MEEEFGIDFEERAARKAAIYGFVTGLIFYLLYVNGILHNTRWRFGGEEYFISLLFGIAAGAIGFLTGMTIFKSNNLTAHFLMPLLALLHYFLWSGEKGGELGNVFIHSVLLIIDLLIAFGIYIGIGIAQRWVSDGK